LKILDRVILYITAFMVFWLLLFASPGPDNQRLIMGGIEELIEGQLFILRELDSLNLN